MVVAPLVDPMPKTVVRGDTGGRLDRADGRAVMPSSSRVESTSENGIARALDCDAKCVGATYAGKMAGSAVAPAARSDSSPGSATAAVAPAAASALAAYRRVGSGMNDLPLSHLEDIYRGVSASITLCRNR